MASPKSKSGVRTGPGRRRAGFTVKVSHTTSKTVAVHPKRSVKVLLQQFEDAVDRSRAAGRAVSFRVDVDPEGATTVTPVEEITPAQTRVMEEAGLPDPELRDALAAARARGRLRAAEILVADDMLSAEAFAELLGTTRVTVNTKRQSGQLLGLDGAKRGFRFPVWQLDADGRPYSELAALHERLGGAWAVYRFLVQPHGELDGLTGRDALEQGKTKAALEVAESVGPPA
ncbi:conserved hypothetical protein [Mesorhizobium prunaredense]|uniref:Uncharacterized protein n=1 Tax=Mesorhizobium prunaredense TaxID=1631249 RepID=A0A1R3V8D5_9HYPH|nr:XRE family transcriptional regulator [Mesorhizobium prunaredense]SIT56162.1 conserved hypothetical protein [Mesorhizobium prunaredense]